MARVPATEELHGHSYTVTMLGTSKGVELARRFLKIIGPAFGSFVDGVDIGKLIDMMDETASEAFKKLVKDSDKSSGGLFKGAVEALIFGLSKTDTEWVINELKESTRVRLNCEGKDIPLAQIYESHFQGELLKLGEWLLFALRAQLGLFSKDSESAAVSRVEASDAA